MTSTLLSDKAQAYLRRLCLDIPSRRVGSAGNRAATDFFAGSLKGVQPATELLGIWPTLVRRELVEKNISMEIESI